MVGLVLVSHSAPLADGLRDMVAQVAGDDVPVATAGGTEDGRLGTSAPRIADAIRSTFERGAEATLVLLDLGSAALSLELALEELDPVDRARVRVSDAPLVEGAVLAAVQASVGASLDEVAEAAAGAASMPKLPGSLTDGRDSASTVLDPAGLHARPAAQFVRTASRFESRITIRAGRSRSADAKSLIALLGLTIRPVRPRSRWPRTDPMPTPPSRRSSRSSAPSVERSRARLNPDPLNHGGSPDVVARPRSPRS